jgi:hypothetical protein
MSHLTEILLAACAIALLPIIAIALAVLRANRKTNKVDFYDFFIQACDLEPARDSEPRG